MKHKREPAIQSPIRGARRLGRFEMQHLLGLIAWVFLFGLHSFAAGAREPAGAVPAVEAAAVRAVIQAQLDAFAAGDAVAAFSYAAPGIRRQFGTPESFVAMVRSAYPVVWRPAAVSFHHNEWTEGDLIQAVQMSDANGIAWLVLYRLERQPDR